MSATTGSGEFSTVSLVVDAAQSGSARVRLVHAASSLGSLGFQSSKGGPATLAFGQSTEAIVAPGALYVTVSGFPDPYSTMDFIDFVDSGETVTLYAAMGHVVNYLIPAWGGHAAVAADRALVRIIMATDEPGDMYRKHLYLLEPGAPGQGLPQVPNAYLPTVSP